MNQMIEEIKEELKKILGDVSIGEMQVSTMVQKLVKTVNYLVTQLKISGQWIDDTDGKEHINSVLANVKEILSENK